MIQCLQALRSRRFILIANRSSSHITQRHEVVWWCRCDSPLRSLQMGCHLSTHLMINWPSPQKIGRVKHKHNLPLLLSVMTHLAKNEDLTEGALDFMKWSSITGSERLSKVKEKKTITRICLPEWVRTGGGRGVHPHSAGLLSRHHLRVQSIEDYSSSCCFFTLSSLIFANSS